MAFAPENELETAMASAMQDPALHPRFLEALLGAEVLIPVPGPPPSQDRLVAAPAGSEIDLPVLEGQDRSFVPVFSSMTQMLRFVPEGTGYMQLRVADLQKLWPDDVWMAINPKGDIGLGLSPDEVKALPDPAPLRENRGEEGYVLGEPKEEPEALLSIVRAFAERTPQVVAAYRALMLLKGPGQKAHVVIGLELDDDAERERIFGQVTEAARESGVNALALVPVRRDEPNDVARYLLESTSPFYSRSS